jgi:hypothetical protein
VEKETAMASSKRSPEKILGVIASIFLLSFARETQEGKLFFVESKNYALSEE